MSRVLIFAPRYDFDTGVTSTWCEDLFGQLKSAGHTPDLRIADEATSEALLASLSDADIFVFYGHGQPHRLIGEPTDASGRGSTLIDSDSISSLGGIPIYAVACQALSVLGERYGLLYPSTTFLGYSDAFSFPQRHFEEFEQVVNEGALALAAGEAGPTVLEALRRGWTSLMDSYGSGSLADTADAFMGFVAARINARGVGIAP